MQKKHWWIGPVGLGILGIGFYLFLSGDYCASAKSRYGIEVPRCPSGEVRQVLEIDGVDLQRSGWGMISVRAFAAYTTEKSDAMEAAQLHDFAVTLILVDAGDKERPVELKDDWLTSHQGEHYAHVKLPEVPDGDYRVRATVRSRLGQDTIDLPLGLYAPARIHVLTDRPLYEPGNQVQYRAVVVRARDLTPIDNRPGTWELRDPTGEVLLEEKTPAAGWGVVAGSFPLDKGAPQGTWTVTWKSGQDQGTASFRVEPFTLPRFRVEAAADAPFYQMGARPIVRGQVVYASGAPVSGADIAITWRSSGDWPVPTAWLRGALPAQAVTDASGRFVLNLPEVPVDLQGQATLHANLAATDPAGDRVNGTASVLLSHDAIGVQGMTELGGLVANSNNRLYLRVTTADGRIVPGADIKVRRAWTPGDEGIDARLDTDGVGRIQIDPGPPVNVVIPAMPVRVRSNIPRDLVSLAQGHELIADDNLTLADLRAVESWFAPLERCTKWVDSSEDRAELGVRVNASGAITAVAGRGFALDRCARDTVLRQRMPAGAERLYKLVFRFLQSPLPDLDVAVKGAPAVPEGLGVLLGEAARDARDCVPDNIASHLASTQGQLPWTMTWQVRAGRKQVETSWNRARDGTAAPPALATCMQARIRGRALDEAAERDSMGVVRYTITRPYHETPGAPPQPTIMKGYELLVSATVDGKPAGETRLRMEPGVVPYLRLRATPVLPAPGQEVTISLLRGPTYTGDLPEELTVRHLGDHDDVKVDRKARSARFVIPDDGKGWYEFVTPDNQARAIVYVRAGDDLDVALTPEQPRYAPGAMALLRIKTRIGGTGGAAAVGLFGVDQSLEQLAALPGMDELAALRPEADMTDTALGALTAQALVLGRIRGASAAEAMVLQVATLPALPPLDAAVAASTRTAFDPVIELTDSFYSVLAELHAQARTWEESAPADDKMHPATMARLWNQAVAASAARGEPVADAFGRRLRLHHLPGDLLALTDPRNVVVVGTRLPEDVENWALWVKRHKP